MASCSLLLRLARNVGIQYAQCSAADVGIWVCEPPPAVYRPRNPKASDFYALVEDNLEELERVYDERYSKQHGYWRPIIRHVIHKFVD